MSSDSFSGVISIGDVLSYLRKTVPFPEEMPEATRASKLEVKDRERAVGEDEKLAKSLSELKEELKTTPEVTTTSSTAVTNTTTTTTTTTPRSVPETAGTKN
jgi:hypothetical protein